MKKLAAIILVTVALAPAAQATSGPGCLVVRNVAWGDVLNLRARPSASSRIVAALIPERHGIIHLDQPCGPRSAPWAQRWCKVSVYDGGGVRRGYVKARFVRDSDCP
jgi:hypothetical protein